MLKAVLELDGPSTLTREKNECQRFSRQRCCKNLSVAFPSGEGLGEGLADRNQDYLFIFSISAVRS